MEETSSENVELSTCNNAEWANADQEQSKNNQAFDVDVIPSPFDGNCCINTAVVAGSENGLNNKNIYSLQKV